jgi:signal transduction histidine kinase/ligand-binding sensor domain-containing protein
MSEVSLNTVRAFVALGILCVLLLCGRALALDPSLDVSQYAHTAWTTRDGFSSGNIYAIAQTPEGYLWFGTEFGLVRFDGVRAVPWQPPAGQQLPEKNVNSLLVSRDGTLWIGTFAGLATWRDGKLASRQELGKQFVASLFEDHEGTVWASTLETHGQLCAFRSGSSQCYGKDGAFGRAVWSLHEDGSGNLWAAAQSGLWRIKPGPQRQYPTGTELIGLNETDDGRTLVAKHGGGLLQLVGDKLETYPIRGAMKSRAFLRDQDVDSNRVLRDLDGGLWIGTVERGLIHIHQGRTDVFTRADGLSGDVILSMFEDREGNIWVSSTGGLDRFRELSVSTVSAKQGLSSDATQSLLATEDGSIWIAAHEGLTRWTNGQTAVFRKRNGLPDEPESLFQDKRGRIWVSTRHGLAYFEHGTFVGLKAATAGEVHYIAGHTEGNLWLSEHNSLLQLQDKRLKARIPWPALGHAQNAGVLLSDPEARGLWMGFWYEGGLSYFKDGRIQKSYTGADGLGEGDVGDLQLDHDGALWVSTQSGGLSRLKDGRIITLTSKNGLPCDAVHWSIEDNDRSLWLYTSCGLVRITRSELNAWIADPKRRIETTVWDSSDGVRLRSSAASPYGPRVTKAADGKLWFVTGDGVQVVDPHHLPFHKLPPPVRIEQITANGKTYEATRGLRLPSNVHNLDIDYTALSFVAPEKMLFRYKLEGVDKEWREVINDREVQYTNLSPGKYRFRVIACNNSGVWNEQGDVLDFSIAPAFYQTAWFRALCAAALLALLWATYHFRLRQLEHYFDLTLKARVCERTRIARELHDTLLQGFQGVLGIFQAGIYQLPDNAVKARVTLEEALDQASEAIAEGRDAVQGLRTSTLEYNDLATALRTIREEVGSAGPKHDPPTFSVIVEGASRKLHPLLRGEVSAIAAEALRNAFRHAAARAVEVELRYDDKCFRLRVRDDGKGIRPEVVREGREGHFGLEGMRERAELTGGKLTIWSQLNEGTEIELIIPASKAYGESARRFWQFRKRSETEVT